MIKCLVKHCENRIHEGPGRILHHADTYSPEPVRSDFICFACWCSLTHGVPDDSINFRNMVGRLIGWPELERKERRPSRTLSRTETSQLINATRHAVWANFDTWDHTRLGDQVVGAVLDNLRLQGLLVDEPQIGL